ncbi:hypothetical protein GCM10009839_71430 [Catenulispora yoronensis]|uniref:histidine kinase n=1 Tax=Catenulispora yoronensis TaxID=450799 RepID=A0ABN2V7J8_9ACTN
MALDDPEASADTLRAAHERIVVANAQQERVIEALLALARGQAGTDRREPVDLAALARNALTACTAHSPADIAVHADLRTAPTLGDPNLAERLIANLMDNALRHNVPGGDIRVETRVDGGRAVLIVRNSGPVIPADAVDRLFQPFTRLDEDRTARGDSACRSCRRSPMPTTPWRSAAVAVPVAVKA